ncbi:hypothetical protein T265_02252 [Opisthorchis viverrini]|uniref:Uncharacterized protein n=1 Tax=Opisthorchis viverrini TaxID=6198 RepID=A0A074ZVI0_OPIVI|nr:hypothetical protein T265_02252 [Opisthorchis viverrini]KER31478.1 hypothetical protein T265_02252 [Opisthorchis viverrini]
MSDRAASAARTELERQEVPVSSFLEIQSKVGFKVSILIHGVPDLLKGLQNPGAQLAAEEIPVDLEYAEDIEQEKEAQISRQQLGVKQQEAMKTNKLLRLVAARITCRSADKTSKL